MPQQIKKFLPIVLLLAVIALTGKYLLPVLLPFLAGAAVALAAEPVVSFATGKLRLPRPLAAGVGVVSVLLLLTGLLSLLGAFTVRELGSLADSLPDLEQTALQGMTVMQDWLVSVADRAPEGVRPLLTRTALELTDGGSVFVEQVTGKLPAMVTGLLGAIPGSALGIGTGVLAGFMISARLPRLRKRIGDALPESRLSEYLPVLRRMRSALGGWLKAQLKLALVTWGIVTLGFVLLRVPYGPLWALPVAIVDAVPMLGTGIALVPCALVAFLQGQTLRAVGFLLTCAAAITARTLLEPRLVGRHLGLDPLLTLLALYAGYRFWGIWGMILAPMGVAATAAAFQPEQA